MANKHKADTRPKGHKHWSKQDIEAIMNSLSPKKTSDFYQCRSDKVLDNANIGISNRYYN